MITTFKLDDIAGWIAILIPVALLLLTVLTAAIGQFLRARQRAELVPIEEAGEVLQSPGVPVDVGMAPVGLVSPRGTLGGGVGVVEPEPAASQALGQTQADVGPVADKAAPTAEAAAQADVLGPYAEVAVLKKIFASQDAAAAASTSQLQARINEHVANKSNQPLAPANIALALRLQKDGDVKEAGNALRIAITEATRTQAAATLADARLALGDVCKTSGDGITACEHWHLARDLYAANGHEAGRQQAVERMDANGCPTDWVLTDF